MVHFGRFFSAAKVVFKYYKKGRFALSGMLTGGAFVLWTHGMGLVILLSGREL
ncbi:hypothetical protein L873DRAFT_1806947 [Choiromyces venosus 120613-1]|uniref:Uncharacterized protein n=1 Tax=Choiromyces venosus 120613-1 TaxID=1336337 RepID=A0A3N4JQ49_9PEZI|nr:hypothetical protein L873DRAFT_1806947 [Choiromyces venosus 120613-1]